MEAIVKKEMKLLDKNKDGLVSEEEFKASGKLNSLCFASSLTIFNQLCRKNHRRIPAVR